MKRLALLAVLVTAGGLSVAMSAQQGGDKHADDRRDLREFAAFNLDFLNAVREGKKAGKSADAIAAAWTIPAASLQLPAAS